MTTLYEDVNASRNQAIGWTEALDGHARTTDDRLVSLTVKVEKLEAEVKSLRAIAAGRHSGYPMELGNTYIATGDQIPSHSAADLLNGNVYVFTDHLHYTRAYAFTKNDSSAPLIAGQPFRGGVVDKTLRNPCQPNNFCYVEI